MNKEINVAIFESASQKEMAAQQMQMRIQMEMEMERQRIQQKLFNTSVGTQQKVARFDPNEREAYQVSLSHLVTMWQVKYGDSWVDGNKPRLEYEEFYVDAFRRLEQNDLLERADGWVRLKENVENILANR